MEYNTSPSDENIDDFTGILDPDLLESLGSEAKDIIEKHDERMEKDRLRRMKASGSLANLHQRDRFNPSKPPISDKPSDATKVDPSLIAEIEDEHDKLMNPKDVNNMELTRDNFDPATFNYLAEFTDDESVWNQDENKD